MEDIYVKCCRCKNVHLHSERKEGRVDKRFGTRTRVCPRCGGHQWEWVKNITEMVAGSVSEAGDSIQGEKK